MHHPSPSGSEPGSQAGPPARFLTSAHRSPGYWWHPHQALLLSLLFLSSPSYPFRFGLDVDSSRKPSLTLLCALTACRIWEGRAHVGFIYRG